jgi:hypothetical protein
MQEITFSEADVQAIAQERYHHPDPRVQRHMEILWLKYTVAGGEPIGGNSKAGRANAYSVIRVQASCRHAASR